MCVLKALHVRFVYFHPLYGRDILNFGSAVRSSGCHNVCLSGLSLSKSLNLFNLHLTLSQVCLRPILGLKALLLRYFVVQTEPKILRLLFLFCLHLQFFEFLDTDNVTPLDSQGVQHLGPVHLPHGLKTDIFHEIVCLCISYTCLPWCSSPPPSWLSEQWSAFHQQKWRGKRPGHRNEKCFHFFTVFNQFIYYSPLYHQACSHQTFHQAAKARK